MHGFAPAQDMENDSGKIQIVPEQFDSRSGRKDRIRLRIPRLAVDTDIRRPRRIFVRPNRRVLRNPQNVAPIDLR